jgi:hypothetical protein
MKKTLGVVLLAAACCGAAYGQASKPSATGAADAVKQLERDWLAAQKVADIGKLGPILADDWNGMSADGTRPTKKEYLDNIKSGASKLDSYEMGAMDVKVLGTIAVVQGSDTEKSSFKGKDTSGKYVWTDVFVLHDGKWQAVRSQSALVVK